MNETKPKEMSLEAIGHSLHNLVKKIRDNFYELLNLLENQSENNQNNENLDANYNKDNNNNENDSINNKKICDLWKNTKNFLKSMHFCLGSFNNKNIIIKFNAYNYNNINRKRNFYLRSDLYSLIYNYLINLNSLLTKDLVNYRKKEINFENRERRIRIFNFSKQKLIESKTINDYIDEYINNNFMDLPPPSDKESNTPNIPKPNIFFNCEINNDKLINIISIEFYNFNILIKLPQTYDNEFNYKACVLIIYKYDQTDYIDLNKKNKLSDLDKLFHKKNELEIENEFQKNNSLKYKNKYLLTKIRILFYERIVFIIKNIMEEIDKDNRKIVGNTLIEFCKRFIYFIRDYNNLFKTKCEICQKIAKYSFTEKCFYPPYIKIYEERNLNSNNISKSNLFYHEECYRRINLPSL